MIPVAVQSLVELLSACAGELSVSALPDGVIDESFVPSFLLSVVVTTALAGAAEPVWAVRVGFCTFGLRFSCCLLFRFSSHKLPSSRATTNPTISHKSVVIIFSIDIDNKPLPEIRQHSAKLV